MFRQMYEEKYMRFPEGRAKAITFSYDDGVVADKRLVSILDKYGLKGTFNLNSLLFDCPNWHNRMDEEQTFNLFYKSGHEVALHGARHIFLDKVPLSEAIYEVVQNRAYLEGKFKRVVRGMAYAYNGFNDEVIEALKSLGVAYARTTTPTHSFEIPKNWLKLNPTCHHTDPELLPLSEKFLNCSPLNEFKARESWLFYVWGHSYEFDDNNNWDIIENLAKCMQNRDDVWKATNIQIYDYVKAYNSLVFSLDGEMVYNPSAQPVWLEIRGETYKIDPDKTVVFKK
jgi:hypothetical protein